MLDSFKVTAIRANPLSLKLDERINVATTPNAHEINVKLRYGEMQLQSKTSHTPTIHIQVRWQRGQQYGYCKPCGGSCMLKLMWFPRTIWIRILGIKFWLKRFRYSLFSVDKALLWVTAKSVLPNLKPQFRKVLDKISHRWYCYFGVCCFGFVNAVKPFGFMPSVTGSRRWSFDGCWLCVVTKTYLLQDVLWFWWFYAKNSSSWWKHP